MTTNNRRDEMLKRARRDPVWADKRPLSAVLDDEIPYDRWARELRIIQRAGYTDLQEFMRKKP